jgi:hypothetical protein
MRVPRLLVEGGRGYLCPARFPRKWQDACVCPRLHLQLTEGGGSGIFSVEVGGVESCFVELPVHGRHTAERRKSPPTAQSAWRLFSLNGTPRCAWVVIGSVR